MAIDLVGIPVVDTDFLKSGFRVKFNKAVDKMIVSMSMVDDSKLRVVTKDGSYAEIDLSEYFYTIDDVNELLVVPYATEEKAGKIRIATMEEVEELDRNDLVVTPYTLGQLLAFYNGRGYMAAEELSAGDFVTFFLDEEEEDEEFQWKVKKAIATGKETLAVGFVVDNVEEGDMAPVKLSGNINDNVGPLHPGKWYYLRSEYYEPEEDPEDPENWLEPYQITTAKPSDPGTYVQQVGYAVSETELMVELHPYEAILGEVFEGLPALVFIKGLEMTVSMFLEDYLVEGIDPESLRYEFRGLPTWISSTQVVFNELSFTGEADKVGDYTVDMIVSGDNATTVVPLRIEVIDAPKVKMTLSPGGEIAKSGVTIFAGPDDYDLSINIVGDYDAYQIIFDGSDGGFTEGNISNPVLSNQSLAVGMHSISIELFKQTGYDQDLEEPIYTSVLIDSRQFFIGKNVGEGNPNKVINIQLDPYGTELSSAGAIVEHDDGGVNLTFAPIGIVFSKLKVTISPNDNPYYKELEPDTTDVTGSIDNEIIDPDTGIATPDAAWRASTNSVTEGDRYWVDGDAFLYLGSIFVGHVAVSGVQEIIIPDGVDTLRVNKQTVDPVVLSVEFPLFQMFDSLTDKGVGDFSALLETEGDDPYTRLVKWTITEELPEPISPSDGLKLVSGSGAILGDIGVSGSFFQLPSNGFNILCPSFSTEVDRIEWTHEIDRGGWVMVDIQAFVGQPTVKSFDNPVEEVNQLAFFNKNSLQIGSIHEELSHHRSTFRGYLDDVLVEVKQGNFIFTDEPLGVNAGMQMMAVTIKDLGNGDEVTDMEIALGNVPTQGYAFPIPVEENKFWAIAALSYDGETLFRRVVTKVNDVVVSDYTLVSDSATFPTMELMEALLWDRSSGVDDPGKKEVVVEFYDNADAFVGEKTTSFYLYEGDPDAKDTTECCDDCDEPYFSLHEW